MSGLEGDRTACDTPRIAWREDDASVGLALVWTRRRWCRSAVGWVAGGLSLGGSVTGCGPSDDHADTLTLAAYSVIREAMREAVLPRFQAWFRQQTGRPVRFEESYGPSGAQSRALASGLDADVALLSHVGDVRPLVRAGLVAQDWDSPPGGVVAESRVVIVHRPGNPWRLERFTDLARPGLQLVFPDPKTSGGARWNLNAVYGAALREGWSPSDIDHLFQGLRRNVVTLDASARHSLMVFEDGLGDAALTYENEVLLQHRRARERNRTPLPYFTPLHTLIVETPAAILERSVERHGTRDLARSFLEFLRSDPGQDALAEFGFRRLRVDRPPDAWTIDELGGWEEVAQRLYGPEGVWTRALLNLRA